LGIYSYKNLGYSKAVKRYGVFKMKTKFLFAALGTLMLASCQCNTTDESCAKGAGAGAGYPRAHQMVQEQKPSFETIDRVFYGFDKYTLTDADKETLQHQAQWLKDNPGVAILVAGNCDERGTREYNIGLGERRANTARDYLVAQGVNPQRITVTSYGKDRPSVAGSNEEAWAQNRNAITILQ
jgi:peptidoglycan-associated lipoprotein